MPGFPEKFMPFMNQPPGSLLSSHAVTTYGRMIHALRSFTQNSLNKVPSWRRAPNHQLCTDGEVFAETSIGLEVQMAGCRAAVLTVVPRTHGKLLMVSISTILQSRMQTLIKTG